MNDPVAEFRNRYVLEELRDGDGVVIDVLTGAYFELNAASVVVCHALTVADTSEQAASWVASQMRVPVPEAADLVRSVCSALERGVPAGSPTGPLYYRSEPDGRTALLENERPILSVDIATKVLSLAADPAELKVPLELYLRSLMPKLLVLLQIPVMHAAAFRNRGSLIAITGKSGAGKTTTARSFARAGADLVSEDLLVVSYSEQSLLAFVQAETLARQWARATAGDIEQTPDRPVPFTGLADIVTGPTNTIDALWIIDANRRSGTRIRFRRLGDAEGVVGLLGTGFLATSDARHWRDFLTHSRRIAERTAVSEATMPNGLDNLASSALDYTVNVASNESA